MYRKVVTGLLVFALFNSSDMLLLLKVKQSGLADTNVIGLYIFSLLSGKRNRTELADKG
jgi:hypothetical protein